MEPVYRYSESTIKPPPIETALTTVYLRKDYKQVERTYMEGQPPITFWTYQEAALLFDEFDEYMKELTIKNTINSAPVPEEVSKLVVGQESGEISQLTLMAAIADLYEAIESVMIGGATNG